MSKNRPRKPQNPGSLATPAVAPLTTGADRQPPVAAVALALAFVVYGFWFFAQQLDELTRDPAVPWVRFHYLLFLITAAPEVWAERWFDQGHWTLADRLPIALTAASIGLIAWMAGSIALRAARVNRGLSQLERLVFASGVGLNLVSLAMLLLGLAGAANNRVVVLGGAVLIAGVWGWFAWRDRRANSPQEATGASPVSADRRTMWWLLLGVPFIAVTLLGSLLPPSDFDVREYHLQAPKEFFQYGRVTFLPHNVYANMPLGSEMHSLLGMMLLQDWWSGALVGKTVQACFTLLTALLLLAAGRRWYSTLTGVIAAVVYLSTPWIVHVATAGLVEGAAAFYCFATLYAWLLWRDAAAEAGGHDKHQRAGPFPTIDGRLLLTGFLAGSAVATKYPAALFVVVPILALVVGWGQPKRFRCAVVFFLAVSAGCGPWLAKNAWFTGNPTYPLLYSVFGGATWSTEKDTRWQAAHRPANFAFVDTKGSGSTDLVDSIRDVFVRSPWLNFVTWPLAGVTLVTAVMAGATRDRRVALLWGYLLFVLAAWWLFTHRIDRFWIPLLPVASLLGGIGATTYRGRAWWSIVAVAMVFALSFDFAAAATNTGPGSSNRFLVPLAKLRNDPERVAAPLEWLNRNTPAGKRVISEGDAQVFDLEMPVLYHTAFDDSPLIQLVQGKTPDEIRAALADVAFVYVNWNEIGRYRTPGNYGYSEKVRPEVLAELVRQKLLGPPVEQFRGAGVEIYPVQ